MCILRCKEREGTCRRFSFAIRQLLHSLFGMELCGADLFFEKQKITISPCMETNSYLDMLQTQTPDSNPESGVSGSNLASGFESGVLGSNPASPQPTADYQSPGGWPATWGGTWLRADLCEGRQRRKLRKWIAGSPKTYKEKKNIRFKREMYSTCHITTGNG